MSEEVKTDLRSEWMSVMSAHTPNYEGWLESLVISERQARLDAETKLRELQDLLYFEEIIDKGNHDSDNLPEGFESQYYDELDQDEAQRLMILRDQAIQESRTRRQNDDTTIQPH